MELKNKKKELGFIMKCAFNLDGQAINTFR